MKLAFLILAHKNPAQLKRLVFSLYHPENYFYIHIDKRVEITNFQNIFKETDLNVQFIVKRENASWGNIGLVQATLNGLKEIFASGQKFTHISLLSGQDYPIKSVEIIRNFFENNQKESFIEAEPFPVKKLKHGGLPRVYSYSFNIGKRRETYIPLSLKNNFSFKGKLLNFALGLYCLFLPKRVFPNNWKPYYGSQWWSLNYETSQYILQFVQENPSYLKFHRYCQIPDEIFFHSIIVNNENIHFINDNLRYIIWELGSSHPKTLGLNDYCNIKSSNKFFARKFDEKIDEKVLDLINKELL